MFLWYSISPTRLIAVLCFVFICIYLMTFATEIKQTRIHDGNCVCVL